MATKYQVLGTDECGSEFFIANNLTESEAYKAASEARENFEEARSIFVEEMIDYRAQAMAEYDEEFGYNDYDYDYDYEDCSCGRGEGCDCDGMEAKAIGDEIEGKREAAE